MKQFINKYVERKERDVGRGPTGIANYIYSIAYVLLVMLLGKPLCFADGDNVRQDQVWDLIPDVYSDDMKSGCRSQRSCRWDEVDYPSRSNRQLDRSRYRGIGSPSHQRCKGCVGEKQLGA